MLDLQRELKQRIIKYQSLEQYYNERISFEK
jgi:hypothetical protein